MTRGLRGSNVGSSSPRVTTSRLASLPRSDVKVWFVTALLVLTGAFLWGRGLALPQLEPGLWWPLLAVLFALTERYTIFVPFKHGETHGLTFVEAPLLLGLFFVGPSDLILAGVVGVAVAHGVFLRTPVIKLAFNVALWVAQTALAIALFTGLLDMLGASRDPLSPSGWGAALITTELMHVFATVLVFTVISLRQGSIEFAQLWKSLIAGAVGTLVVTNLGLVTALMVRDNQAALVLLAGLAALTFALYRGYHVQRLRYGRLELLYEFTRAVDESMQSGSVVDTVEREARLLLRARHASVVLFTEEGEAEGGWWAAAKDGKVLRLPRGRRGELAPELTGSGLKDAISAPLRDGGRVVGALVLSDRIDDVSTFEAEDEKLLQALAGHAGIALSNSALVERVRAAAAATEHIALHDDLTGLPNRLLFKQRLEKRLETVGSAAVLLMDLDRFKEVNDTLGHDVGDRLLKLVGARLRHLEHEQTVVARLGGDEFAVMVAGDDIHIEGMIQRITRDFSTPFKLGEVDLDVSASIGIAMAPRDGDSAAILLRRAEVAMYDAKERMAGVAHYSPEDDPYSARRLSLTSDLARALADRSLELHYQPQAVPATGMVTGVEALLRWRHPVWGNVPPDEFIPLAEHTGLIRPLTRFVIETAVHQCARWRDAGTPVVMAVNVSMRNLLEPELSDDVARMLVQADLPAGLLKLEVTESAFVADTARSVEALNRLVALGLKISVDDFGTGYSSLTRLRNLPVHEVKIDRAFIRNVATDPDDLAVARAVIHLGHDLGLRVVAEGVEDAAGWAVLVELECDLLQGYFLAKPMAASDLTPWLAEHFGSYATRLRDVDDVAPPTSVAESTAPHPPSALRVLGP